MSNTPSSIIINSAKIDRIDSENVGLELIASVLDSENDTIPGVEVSLVINRTTVDKLISDSDGFIDVKKVLELEEGENISVQLKEVVSGVKSKVRMLIDIPNIEEKKISGGKKKDNENKDVKKESTHEKSLDNKKEKALNLVRINGLNLNTPECIEFSDNEEIVTEAVHNNPDAFQYASQRLKRNNVFIEKHILDFPKIIEHIDQSLITKIA